MNSNNKRYIGFLEDVMASADPVQAKAFAQQQRSDVIERSADGIILEAFQKFEFTRSEVCAQIVVDAGVREKRVV